MKKRIDITVGRGQVTTSFRNFKLCDFEALIAEPSFSFEVSERPCGGWKLTLYEGKEEMGGGVFPAGDDGYADAYREGFDWQYQRL